MFDRDAFSSIAFAHASHEAEGLPTTAGAVESILTITTRDDYLAARDAWIGARLRAFKGDTLADAFEAEGAACFTDKTRDPEYRKAEKSFAYVVNMARAESSESATPWAIPKDPLRAARKDSLDTGNAAASKPGKGTTTTTDTAAAVVAQAQAALALRPELAACIAQMILHPEFDSVIVSTVTTLLHPLAARPTSRTADAIDGMEPSDD